MAESEYAPARRRISPIHRLIRLVMLFMVVLMVIRLAGCAETQFYHPTAGPTPAPDDLDAELISFPSTDGTRLAGWFIRATNAGDAPGPAILHVHGNAGNITAHRFFSEYLPDAGYHVLLFDYRGYGQSEGNPRLRGQLIADTHAALATLRDRPEVDNDRIGIFGQSLGGAIAINVMAAHPEIRAGVFESAFDSWRRAAATAVGGDPPNPIARLLAWILIPDQDRPLDAIARIAQPILLTHGDADAIVPVSHSRNLAAAASDATLQVFPGGEHNDLRLTHPELETLVIEFLDRELAPVETPSG